MIRHAPSRFLKSMNPFCAFMLSVLLCCALPAQGQVAPKDPAPPPAAGKTKAKKPGFFDRLFQGSGGREGSKNQSRSDSDNDDDDDDVKGGKVKVPREGEQPATAVVKTQPKAGKATTSTPTKKPSPKADAAAEAAKSAPTSENTAAAKEPGPASAPSQPGAQPSNAGAPPTPAAKEDEGTIQFARPVPGRRGMVYPPGAEEVQANMIDVSDMTPGQLARDPRTGKKFRVP
jgi:hypothetical protein